MTDEAQPDADTEVFKRKAPTTGPTYRCRFCGLSYAYMSTLKAHERVHNVQNPYVCSKCGDAFGFASELKAHSMGHIGKAKDMYKCKCGRGFYNYSDLISHKHEGDEDFEASRTKDLPFSTDFSSTDGIYKSSSSATTWVAPARPPVDLRKTPYICQFCNKCYADSGQLKSHMYSHSKEPAYRLCVRSSYLSTYTG